ncbi:Gfo/Idh/MocA family oxidoreductase [Amylibacter sp.]|nr:Gfo/Idh/MocA family oxidoreductase [Amylibacter sp.]MDB9785747.1 Gfo/Idh/MocA family oxidoreductase [Amylibacter sp.]
MSRLGIGIIGGGYMGKAHAAAYGSVGTLFETTLRPELEMVCATSISSAEKYQKNYGFKSATTDWKEVVNNPNIDAVVIASPQSTHCEIALAAFKNRKHVFCEKPLGASVEESRTMLTAAEASGMVHMTGFNYIRTPASQYARQLIVEGRIGDITWFRGEHTEDFLADPSIPTNWRTTGKSNGTMGDLAPHMINAARALVGPISSLTACVETVHANRPGGKVTNDDQAQMMCKFENGAQGHLFFSRIATGRKMGYAYEIHGTKGSIKFDQEDQNALYLYTIDSVEKERGFKKILTGPAHPDYKAFCQGPGHGTGYQDQIIIEANDFLRAIHEGRNIWPTFSEGMEVNRVVSAALDSSEKNIWVKIADY